jgi:hypothetical protein
MTAATRAARWNECVREKESIMDKKAGLNKKIKG